MTSIGIRIFAGLPPVFGKKLLVRIAEGRFDHIRASLTPRDGEYVYSGCRCKPNSVAHRFASENFRPKFPLLAYGTEWRGLKGKLKYAWACFSTLIGLQDDALEKTWHERASAEWWYWEEKDWD